MADTRGLSEERAKPAAVPGLPLLDRSRAQLRIPADLLTEALRIAHVQSIPDLGTESLSARPSDEVIERLAPVLDDGQLDPVALDLLKIVNQASLMVAIDLSYLSDSSVPTIWATPREAVVSSSLDPDHVELRPVPVSQLPQVLAQLIVLRSPRFVGDVPISIANSILAGAEAKGSREASIEALTGGGLDADQAVLLLDLQRPDVRRWRISSTWSTDDGQEMTEIEGLDAGPSGQWLVETTGPDNSDTEITYSPQGHGEVMSAFRSVLPRNWMGTPLNRPPS